MFSVALQI